MKGAIYISHLDTIDTRHERSPTRRTQSVTHWLSVRSDAAINRSNLPASWPSSPCYWSELIHRHNCIACVLRFVETLRPGYSTEICAATDSLHKRWNVKMCTNLWQVLSDICSVDVNIKSTDADRGRMHRTSCRWSNAPSTVFSWYVQPIE